jgi:shikimate kinase
VGSELSKKRKMRFLDLDELIELKERMSISDIFSKNGEAYFRKLEKQALKDVSKEDNFVVSCGGGIVMNEDNIKVMKNTGIVICLNAKPQVILKRISSSTHRPLLNVANPKEKIELLLKLRSPYYALADKSIDTSRLSVKEVVGKISAILSKRKK